MVGKGKSLQRSLAVNDDVTIGQKVRAGVRWKCFSRVIDDSD